MACPVQDRESNLSVSILTACNLYVWGRLSSYGAGIYPRTRNIEHIPGVLHERPEAERQRG